MCCGTAVLAVLVLLVCAPPAFAAQTNLDLLSDANVRLEGSISDGAGESVAAAGDVNDDGREDVILGAPFQQTTTAATLRARLTSSTARRRRRASISRRWARAAFESTAGQPTTLLGFSVATAGDVNDDGRDDVIPRRPAR